MTDELQEKITWQNINSSKEKGKILTGNIIAIEVEKMKDENITCAIVNFRGIKVLIPVTEIIKESQNNKKILRNMMGAEIKFIILEADKISLKAIGSRIKAMERLLEINIKKADVGDKIYGKIIGVWKKYIRIECLGMDFIMKAQDLQYGYIEDVLKKDLEENERILEIMHLIGRKRGAIVSGGNIDEEKVARIILDDFRSGKIGRITLEKI